jgi:acyl-CoA thioesterase FadM
VTVNIPNVELTIPVKTYDVDMAQIVHNAVYIRCGLHRFMRDNLRQQCNL